MHAYDQALEALQVTLLRKPQHFLEQGQPEKGHQVKLGLACRLLTVHGRHIVDEYVSDVVYGDHSHLLETVHGVGGGQLLLFVATVIGGD